MVTVVEIERREFCRNCLNETYHINLKRRDVLIYDLPCECKRCRQVKHIVTGVKLSKRWKLLMARR